MQIQTHTSTIKKFSPQEWNDKVHSKCQFPSYQKIVEYLENHPLTNQTTYKEKGFIEKVAAEFADQNKALHECSPSMKEFRKYFSYNQSFIINWNFAEALIDLLENNPTDEDREFKEPEQEINFLKNLNFSHIKNGSDVAPFAGKIVAFVRYFYFDRGKDFNPKEDIKFGFVEPDFEIKQFNEKGYNLAELIETSANASINYLIESEVHPVNCNFKVIVEKTPRTFGYLCMREATYREVKMIQSAIQGNEKKFGFFDFHPKREQMDQILEEHLARLYTSQSYMDMLSKNWCIII